MRRIYGLVLGTVALGTVAGMASAMPLSQSAAGVNAAINDSGLVEQVHACNRVCRKGAVEEWGGAVAWHRHVGKACKPVKCSP
jgi:hypothetical protein